VYVIYIGIVFENLFFSFGLAQRIRFLKAENEKLDLSNTKLKFFNLEAEYKLLKNQVSPHFIFNTFETIKYLSKHESEKVESFINNLSEFMRTSLKNDKGVVSLEEEMGLLKNYIYLQQVRFAEALHIEIDSFDNHKYKKVPYFSVITLVENAIKHNVLTVEKPLKIGIHFDKEYLKVCNTLQRKKVVENSTKIGLQNLNERYQLLGASAILVEESETEFCVKIKMIEP
jgi:LytS/YehU family sensor histidine kinase